MTIIEYIKKKIYNGNKAIQVEPKDVDRLTFINNDGEIMRLRTKEFDLWYEGDGDELLNFYTYNEVIGYHFEPFYWRNKRNYFWAIGATESDIKRTHSGQPRNIVDTLVNIIRFPMITAGSGVVKDSAVEKNLKKILNETGLKEIYKQEQMPLTLVEGWGCFKINWDKDDSEYPQVTYYKADNVDFVYANSKIIGAIFKDYYSTEDGKEYILCESRRLEKRREEDGTVICVLVIENDLFERTGGESIKAVDLDTLPELRGTEKYIEIGPCNFLLAVPSIIFKNTSNRKGYGRSIFTGKIDLFDDLDQTLSQSSNSVRKSTPIEYFNSEFLERDKNGMPIQPKAYDRKYSIYNGQRDANGAVSGEPVTVTQPVLNLEQYNSEAQKILLQIVNGIMSPATLGIDIAKKDNAEAQREKEKVTIFTRNAIIDTETEILKDLCNQLLCAYEFMTKGVITVKDYDVGVKFSEFADDSFENKVETLGAALDSQNISPEMYLDKLYNGQLSKKEYDREYQFLIENNVEPRKQGFAGMAGGGENTEGLLANMMGDGDD